MARMTERLGGTHLPGIAILAALLSVGVVAVGATGGAGSSQATGALGPARAPETAVELELGSGPEMSRARELSEVQVPKRSDTLAILKDHFGDDWPAARDELFAGGLDEKSLPVLLPWEEAAPIHRVGMRASSEFSRDVMYRELMTWPGREYADEVFVPNASNAVLTPESLARSTGVHELTNVSQADLERIDMDLRAVNDDLDRVIHRYMDALDEALVLEFESGGLSRAPLERPASGEAVGEIYRKSASAGGWKSYVSITKDRYPYVADLKSEIKEMRSQRKLSLAAMAATLGQNGN
jgi:hypothetical protein